MQVNIGSVNECGYEEFRMHGGCHHFLSIGQQIFYDLNGGIFTWSMRKVCALLWKFTVLLSAPAR